MNLNSFFYFTFTPGYGISLKPPGKADRSYINLYNLTLDVMSAFMNKYILITRNDCFKGLYPVLLSHVWFMKDIMQ